MSNFSEESAAIPDSPLMDDLPPVQPPSAGFIVQLFVFPALIVMAVVAIWWMFGLIASGDQDWRKLVQELQSPNTHVRKRAMYGLAQVLDQDAVKGDNGQHLAASPEIAQALTDQLLIELRKSSTSEEGVAFQAYLTRALGMMDSLPITAPALHTAMEPQRDLEIRKSAVISLSFVAGRAMQRHEQLNAPESVAALIELSTDPLPVLQQSAAFALGLFDSPDATHQLEVLLGNGNRMTRANAAIALARHGSTAGYAVILDALEASKPDPNAANVRTDESDEQFMIAKNILKAVKELAPKFDQKQRQSLLPIVNELASRHPENRIQIDAADASVALKAAGTNDAK